MICHLHYVTECLHYVTVCKHSVSDKSFENHKVIRRFFFPVCDKYIRLFKCDWEASGQFISDESLLSERDQSSNIDLIEWPCREGGGVSYI